MIRTQPAGAIDPILEAVEARVAYLRSSTEAPAADGWIASADLVAGGPVLADLMATTGAGRGTTDPQVAASLFTQAYAFRIAGVALAAYAIGLDVPATDPATTAIRIARHRPSAVAHLDPTPRPADPEQLARDLLGGHLAPFITAVRGEVTVGERLLWGDVAASCAVALRAVEGASPAESAAIRDRADAFLAASTPWLDGLGRFVVVAGEAGEARDGWFWERTGCCLWYQADGGSLCDDCSLHDPDERRAAWRASLDEVDA